MPLTFTPMAAIFRFFFWRMAPSFIPYQTVWQAIYDRVPGMESKPMCLLLQEQLVRQVECRAKGRSVYFCSTFYFAVCKDQPYCLFFLQSMWWANYVYPFIWLAGLFLGLPKSLFC